LFALKHLIHIVLALICPLLSLAQFYVKGQVQDEAGKPLQNVTIILHSTGYMYRSGVGGGFGIITQNQKDTLSLSLQGYGKVTVPVDATAFTTVQLKKADQKGSSRQFRLSSLTQNLRRDVQQQWFNGDETYVSIIENQFIDASSFPLTGITLNVDRASYSNIRRFIGMKSPVPPDAVRLEEMLNYFNFGYREPSDNKTFEISTLLTSCPWNDQNQLLFAQISSKKLSFDSLPPSHLVFLIDVSGSMDMPNRLPLLKSGFKALVNNLRPIDSVSIVVYGGTVGIPLTTTGGDEKEKIFKVIDELQPGGSTPGESGVKLAYSVARNHFIKNGNNRIILATDGDFNVGLRTEEELEEMIVSQRQAGIYLTCLGIGMGNYKDSKIQTLAQKGNGNFAYLDSYAEAEKVLLKEFTQTLYTVADDVYLNVNFNPAYVKQYRLLGFDNKVGAIKDTTAIVEGGEVGSAYSIVVAFEVVPTSPENVFVPGKAVRPVNFSLEYKLPGNRQQHWLKENPEVSFTPFAQLTKCYQFASAVLMFGSLLRNSKFVKNNSWNEILSMAAAAAETGNYSQKEFISLVEQAKSIYSKKRKKDD
jgi:Ca-activated chloride channel family protein